MSLVSISGTNKKRNHLNQRVKRPDYKVAYVQLVSVESKKLILVWGTVCILSYWPCWPPLCSKTRMLRGLSQRESIVKQPPTESQSSVHENVLLSWHYELLSSFWGLVAAYVSLERPEAKVPLNVKSSSYCGLLLASLCCLFAFCLFHTLGLALLRERSQIVTWAELGKRSSLVTCKACCRMYSIKFQAKYGYYHGQLRVLFLWAPEC